MSAANMVLLNKACRLACGDKKRISARDASLAILGGARIRLTSAYGILHKQKGQTTQSQSTNTRNIVIRILETM